MNVLNYLSIKTFAPLFFILLLLGCSPSKDLASQSTDTTNGIQKPFELPVTNSGNQPTDAINTTQKPFELPIEDSESQPTEVINATQNPLELPIDYSEGQPTDAINETRKSLELQDLPLEFVENTGMINSPSGGLEVANYRDNEGRIFSVDLKTNQVVEIDARAILSGISPETPSLSSDEVKAKAMKYAKAVVPNFDTLQSSLQYEEGGKVDNYFFTWYPERSSGSRNRPFLQFGFHNSGVLFGYYNTLSVEN